MLDISSSLWGPKSTNDWPKGPENRVENAFSVICYARAKTSTMIGPTSKSSWMLKPRGRRPCASPKIPSASSGMPNWSEMRKKSSGSMHSENDLRQTWSCTYVPLTCTKEP